MDAHAHTRTRTPQAHGCTRTGDGGIGLTLRNIKNIIDGGFVLRLHGLIVDWKKLEEQIKYQKLSPLQREKLENSKLDAEMKAYWAKAVKFVEDGKTHPGNIIDQPFVHARIEKFHNVSFCVLCVYDYNICTCLCMFVRRCRNINHNSVIAVARNGGSRMNTRRTTVGNVFVESVASVSIPLKLRYFRQQITWLVHTHTHTRTHR